MIWDFIPAEKMYTKRKEIIFVGDFNTNLLDTPENQNGPNKGLTNVARQFCLTSTIQQATRTKNHSKTQLDVALASHPERLLKSGTLHDRAENVCTVSTSHCPIQSLRKPF